MAGGDQQTQNLASIYVVLVEPQKRVHSQYDLMDLARKRVLAKLPPELRTSVAEVALISAGMSTAAVQYVLAGPDLERLQVFAGQMAPKIQKHASVVDFDTNLILGKPELEIGIDRDRAADLGVSVADVARTLRMLVAGVKSSSYAEGGRQDPGRI